MDIKLVKLYDAYSPLLSERQNEIMSLYYNEDESLSEIAENTGITRQGVRDHIKKAEAQLTSFESALGLAQKLETLRNETEKAQKALACGDTAEALRALSEISVTLE